MTEKQSDVIKLNFPDNVRMRPGMYIGDLVNASVLIREIIDNAIDEVYSSRTCDHIIIYNDDVRATIIDNGRGIPIKKLPNEDSTMAYESIMSLHAGSKFNKTTAQAGMNGVGSSVVNALSTSYDLIVKVSDENIKLSTDKIQDIYSRMDKTDKLYYHISTNRGVLISEDIIKYDDIINIIPGLNKESIDKIDIGTLVSFVPDDKIFESTKMSIPNTLNYFKYIIHNVYEKDVQIFINDKEYSDYYVPHKYNTKSTLFTRNPQSKNQSITYLFSFDFKEEFDSPEFKGSVNSLIVDAGLHINQSVQAFKKAFEYVFPGDYRDNHIRGLKFTSILLCPEPSFSSQTKERLTGIEGFGYDDLGPLIDEIVKVIRSNIEIFENHKLKVIEYNATLKNLSKIDFIKSRIPIIAEDNRRAIAMTPINVRTCTTHDRSKAELFICEGKSAASTLTQARNPVFNAIMPMRGKPLNTAALNIKDILNNEEMRDIIATIGVGVNDHYNIDVVNYGKIIIVADADPDGGNIASLVLGLIATHLTFLLDNEMVFIINMPLYKQGKKYIYEDNIEELDKNKDYKRFKGLGEMNPSELKETAIDPNTRRLIQVTRENIDVAIRLITTTYARKELLKSVGNILEDELLTSEETNK